MEDILFGEYYVYHTQLKEVLAGIKKHLKNDTMHVIVDELSEEESKIIKERGRLVLDKSTYSVEKRELRSNGCFNYLKIYTSKVDPGNIFHIKIMGKKLIHKNILKKENNMAKILHPQISQHQMQVDNPEDFKEKFYANEEFMVVHLIPKQVDGVNIGEFDLSVTTNLKDIFEARSIANKTKNSINYICAVVTTVDNRDDARVQQIDQIISKVQELAQIVLHNVQSSKGLPMQDISHELECLSQLSKQVDAIKQYVLTK